MNAFAYSHYSHKSALLRALDRLHSLGFVHGDVRPQNIVVSTAGPVLVDFGRCRLASEEERADEREALEELLDMASVT